MRGPDTDRATCDRCGGRVLVRLAAGQVCPTCTADDAWTRYASGGQKLVIDRAEIDRTLEHRDPKDSVNPGRVPIFHLLRYLWSLPLGAIAIFWMVQLFEPHGIGPLAELREAVLTRSGWTTALGVACLLGGWWTLRQLRRGRLFRAWPFLAANAVGLIAGAAAFAVGGLHWLTAAHGIGWEHLSMPPFDSEAFASPLTRAVAKATAVIVAPDENGDLRSPGVGAGALIHRTPKRVWIVTCSHVAMPYAAVAAFRNAAEAQPVWVYFSDGREVQGRVRWTAQPPLDIALVEVRIDNPPAPVPVSTGADAVTDGSSVAFVPNPFRAGWQDHTGVVLNREAHLTPAGEYRILYTTLPVLPGDSGTGLFDGSGRLVGLNTWTQIGPQGPMGIGLPSDAMGDLLEMIENDDLEKLDRVFSGPRSAGAE